MKDGMSYNNLYNRKGGKQMTEAQKQEWMAVHRLYATLCRKTYLNTGRESALYQAELHEASIARLCEGPGE